MNKVIALFVIVAALLVAPVAYAQPPGPGCHVIDGTLLCPPEKPHGCTIYNGERLCIPSAEYVAEMKQKAKAAQATQEAAAAQFRALCVASGGNLDVTGTVCIKPQPRQQVWVSSQFSIHTHGRGFSSDVYVSSPGYGWYGGPRYGSYLGW